MEKHLLSAGLNNGNMVIDPGAGNEFDSGWTFGNTGTVTVNTGTFAMLTNVTQLSGSTLTGGTRVVSNGGALVMPSAITVNQARVTLNGGGSKFDAINSLADNQGSFSIQGGRAFSTAGSLQNSGSLLLGAQLTVNGNLTLSHGFSLVFDLNSISSGNAIVTGTTALDGTLAFSLSPDLEAALNAKSSFTLLESTGLLSGGFSNALDGQRLTTQDGTYSFVVNYGTGIAFNPDDIVLSDFQSWATSPSPPPGPCCSPALGAILLFARKKTADSISPKNAGSRGQISGP